MERRADLHLHTYFSDGTFSPEEVIIEAKKAKIDAIAICDHDCTDALEEASYHALRNGIELVPGVEVSCEQDGIEIHMLGYFIDKDSKPMKSLLKELKENRVSRIHKMVEKLKKHKIDIEPEEVFSLSPRGSTGRLHIATVLYNKKVVTSMKEAFNKYLGDDAPCCVNRFDISPEKAIGTILKSGGVPVLAHPRVMGRDSLIVDFMKAGLRGLEVFHSDHDKNSAGHYFELAQKYGLLMTGGSDCHGFGSEKKIMGGVTVPYSIVEKLKREHEEILKEI